MQTLIINLPRHRERLAFQTRQMARLELPYQLVQAVDANTLPDDAYNRLAGTWERPLRKPEVCCYLSHVNAWRAVVDSGQPALILEDDALLANTVPGLLSKLTELRDIDLIVLEVRARKKVVARQGTQVTSDVRVLPLFQDRTGSAGYVLWPSGARKLLEKSSLGLAGPSDAFISSLYTLRALQAEPAQVIQLDMCEKYGLPSLVATSSSIGAVSRPVITKSRGRFLARRLLSQLRIGWRILSVWHKAERREIALAPQHFQ